MKEWIQLPDKKYNDVIVHEVKCPVCKYKETYTNDKKPSDHCAVCEERLVIKNA